MGCASHIGEGWYELVRKLDNDITKICSEYVVDQIKEKFGTLRYYISGLTENISDEKVTIIYSLIREAEVESGNTCAICADAGQMINFNGVYESNSKGGVIHWTHHDPNGSHIDGWLKHKGRTYQ